MRPRGAEHAHLVSRLARVLTTALGLRAEVRLQAPRRLRRVRARAGHRGRAARRHSREHPETALLVVEVADSSLRKDHALKTPPYAAAGIAEHWIVNLVDRVVEDRAPDPRRRGMRRVEARPTAGAEPLRVLAFPHVAIEVGTSFGDARALKPVPRFGRVPERAKLSAVQGHRLLLAGVVVLVAPTLTCTGATVQGTDAAIHFPFSGPSCEGPAFSATPAGAASCGKSLRWIMLGSRLRQVAAVRVRVRRG